MPEERKDRIQPDRLIVFTNQTYKQSYERSATPAKSLFLIGASVVFFAQHFCVVDSNVFCVEHHSQQHNNPAYFTYGMQTALNV